MKNLFTTIISHFQPASIVFGVILWFVFILLYKSVVPNTNFTIVSATATAYTVHDQTFINVKYNLKVTETMNSKLSPNIVCGNLGTYSLNEDTVEFNAGDTVYTGLYILPMILVPAPKCEVQGDIFVTPALSINSHRVAIPDIPIAIGTSTEFTKLLYSTGEHDGISRHSTITQH